MHCEHLASPRVQVDIDTVEKLQALAEQEKQYFLDMVKVRSDARSATDARLSPALGHACMGQGKGRRSVSWTWARCAIRPRKMWDLTLDLMPT